MTYGLICWVEKVELYCHTWKSGSEAGSGEDGSGEDGSGEDGSGEDGSGKHGSAGFRAKNIYDENEEEEEEYSMEDYDDYYGSDEEYPAVSRSKILDPLEEAVKKLEEHEYTVKGKLCIDKDKLGLTTSKETNTIGGH